MKCQITICCLLISANFAFFTNGAKVKFDSDEDFSDDSTESNEENDETRWMLELADFEEGLKMMNDKGELFELTTDETPSRTSLDSLNETVKFRFYTGINQTNYQQVTLDYRSINSSSVLNFRADVPTAFITHGWQSNGDSPSCTLVRDEYLRYHDMNVIIIDWSDISAGSYLFAVKRIREIGQHVAAMIDHLESNNKLNTEQTTLAGLSLGAHILGIAAYNTRGIIEAVFGLDPALPLFKHAHPGSRISRYDAKHVQIIHTNAGVLGYDRSIGRSDFYPNGGTIQSGCPITNVFSCSHSRVYELFAESINSQVGFWGKRCRSAIEFNHGRCTDQNIAKMGGITIDSAVRGSYYLTTRSEPPYAMGIDG